MSLRHRLSNPRGGRKPAGMQQQQQQQPPKRQEKLPQPHHSPDVGDANYGDSFRYQPSVLDNLSVTLGHAAGHFDAVKGNLRNIYHSLVIAMCRHDPLPEMVRAAIVKALLPVAPKVSSPPRVHHHIGVHQPLFEQQQRSDIETITALDIPYTMRHFDFDLSVVNNEVSGAAQTVSALATSAAVGMCSGAAAAGGSFSFSLTERRTTPGRGGSGSGIGSGGGGGGDVGAKTRAYRLIAGLLLDIQLSGTVRWASKEAAMRRCRFGGVSSMDRSGDSSGTLTFVPPRGTFDTCPPSTSTEFSSSPSNSNNDDSFPSPPPPPSLLTTSASCAAGERSGVLGGTSTTLNLTGQMIPTGLDGSNSNRATSQFSQQQQSRTTAADTGQRLCALHSDRSRIPTSESSCAVCASQHFLHKHLQRLAQEPGGLTRLEDLLCDCFKLQEQWRRSVHWVAGNVKDKRLPESLRPLMRCIGTDAICDSEGVVGCSGNGGGGGGGVTLNPQIIISTDGHCSALQCVNRSGSGSGGGMTGGGSRWPCSYGGIGGGGGGGSGGGGGGSGGCCWNAPPSIAKESMPPP